MTGTATGDPADAATATGDDGARPWTLLVADDNPDDAVVLGIAADELGGTRLDVVESGDELLARIAASPAPSAILLDWNLAGTDAATVLRALRDDGRWGVVPVIVYSGEDDPAIAAEAVELGAVGFEVKAAGLDAVAAMLARVRATALRP